MYTLIEIVLLLLTIGLVATIVYRKEISKFFRGGPKIIQKVFLNPKKIGNLSNKELALLDILFVFSFYESLFNCGEN